jgi:hypothetical protein
MTQFVLSQHSAEELYVPIMPKLMTEHETKEYHLKKFAEWGKKWEQEEKGELVFCVDRNVYRNGKLFLKEPSDEDKEWVLFRLSHPVTWPRVRENNIGDFKNWR